MRHCTGQQRVKCRLTTKSDGSCQKYQNAPQKSNFAKYVTFGKTVIIEVFFSDRVVDLPSIPSNPR